MRDILGQVVGESLNAVDKLRHQNHNREGYEEENYDVGHRDCECLAYFGFLYETEDAVKEFIERIYHVGKDEGQNQRTEIAYELGYAVPDTSEMCQKDIEKDAGADGDRHGIPGFFFDFVKHYFLLPFSVSSRWRRQWKRYCCAMPRVPAVQGGKPCG